MRTHDIGLKIVKNDKGELGFAFYTGGGQGRTPIIGPLVKGFVAKEDLLSYLDATLRVYNMHGRRDNIYKARIKILVKAIGPEEFARQVETEWVHAKDSPTVLTDAEYARVAAHFTSPAYEKLPNIEPRYIEALADSRAFSQWTQRNVHAHRVDGYCAVTLSLKKPGVPPGDATADQMDFVADLADRFSFAELRVSHEQNLILADVRKRDLFELWLAAKSQGLATPNIGLLTNIVCCPGGDFCSLANAKSIPVAQAIQERFDDLDYLHDIGELDLNISGCMNSCGHHHIGHIGILGVDKNGSEWYQVSIGGAQGTKAALGEVIGPSFAAADVPDVISQLIDTYVAIRLEDEPFVDTVHRVGIAPFKSRVYAEPRAVAHA